MNTDAIDLLIRRELPAAARGDRDAYGRIIQASQNAVTAVALAITRDVPASEDIAQEAFLSAWQHLKRLQNPASFLPWLRQITRNLARDHLRAHRQRPLDGEAAELAIAHAADPSGSPMERLIDDEREAVAADLISDLPEESREVLLLYYREGRSSRQVAELLGLSDAAVRKRLSRARQSVRDDLLRRFADFARDSAPGAAFALTITTAIGGFSKPAAAAGAAVAGSSMAAGIAAKSVFGSIAASGMGLFTGALVMWLCRRLLARYADDDAERRSILRTYDVYLATTFTIIIGAFVVHWLFDGWIPMFAVVIAGLAIVNYQLLVSLPRVMNPLLARDALRNPHGAARRQLLYRLTFGVSGTMISNLAVLGMLAVLYLHTA
jgi:RNA polymerase sigma factor (sigma-70 family)